MITNQANWNLPALAIAFLLAGISLSTSIPIQTDEVKLVPPEAQNLDHTGYAVGLGGRILVIGAPNAEYARGTAHVYGLHNGEWTFSESLHSENTTSGSQFGISVGIDETANNDQDAEWTWVAIGIPEFQSGGAGRVAMYRCRLTPSTNPDSTRQQVVDFVHEYDLTAPDGLTGDSFGEALALRSGILVVGAKRADTAEALEKGAVYVFLLSETGSWVLHLRIMPDDASSGAFDNFGHSLAIGRDWLAVGAPWGRSASGLQTGVCYLYHLSSENSGILRIDLQARIAPPNTTIAEQFGSAVGVSREADRVAVGARWDADQGFDSGAVFIYRLPDATLETKLWSPEAAPGDQFGSSLAFGSQRSLAVGAPWTHRACHECGAVYIFHSAVKGADKQEMDWVFVDARTVPANQADSHYGGAIAMSADRIAVGAHLDVFGQSGAVTGAVYISSVESVIDEPDDGDDADGKDGSDGISSGAVAGIAVVSAVVVAAAAGFVFARYRKTGSVRAAFVGAEGTIQENQNLL